MARITDEERKRFHEYVDSALDKLDSPKNIKKNHWKHLSIKYLAKRLYQEYLELWDAIKIWFSSDPEAPKHDELKKDVESECYDNINFLLFIIDNLRNEKRNTEERLSQLNRFKKELSK